MDKDPRIVVLKNAPSPPIHPRRCEALSTSTGRRCRQPANDWRADPYTHACSCGAWVPRLCTQHKRLAHREGSIAADYSPEMG